MRIIRNFATFIAVLCSTVLYAQSSADGSIEMADRLKADGKIYVVVGVVTIILIGLLLYLVMIDRKVAKMEKEIEADKNK
jgi:CcmD family protein